MFALSSLLVVTIMSTGPAPVFAGRSPVADEVLGQARGAASPSIWVHDALDEQAAVEGQGVSAVMREGNENWFADNNVRLFANAAISRD